MFVSINGHIIFYISEKQKMIKIQKYIEEKKKIYDFLLNFLEISDKNHFYKFNKFHDNKKLFSESQ